MPWRKPPRYVLAGEVLADAAAERRPDVPALHAVRRAATRAGRDAGRRARPEVGGRRAAPLTVTARALERLGFEPERRGGRVLLRNCPFHDLVQGHRDLVFGMNRALLQGVVEGLGVSGLTAEPFDQQGYCCVEVRPA